MMIWLNNFIF